MSNNVPTYDEFIVAYPIFAPPAAEVADIQYQLDYAARLLSKVAWHDWYSDGIMLLVAHNLTMWLRSQSSKEGGTDAAVGNVASVSGAGLAISFESSTANASPGSKSNIWYNKTVYGQQFLHLQFMVIPSAGLTA